MAGPYKTRCPHCGAQFKISDEHLGQARGAVRCGSCLRIFQATDHLQGDAVPPARADRWRHAMDDEPPQDDQRGPSLGDDFLDLDGDDSEASDPFADLDEAGAGGDNADESWAEALLQELDDDRDGGSPPPGAPPRAEPAPRRATPPAGPAAERGDDPFEFLNSTAARRHGNDQPEYLAPPPGGPAVLAKWGLLSLLALLVLAGQYAVFHFQELARTPQWRPYYAQACEVLGCSLPLRSDPGALRGANLVVRSHPDYRNALMVDALLFNEADWPQPFPVLELTFQDLEGNIVASRRFPPAEYLRGELAGAGAMPVATPVHIGLEIVDPGPRAVNYNLRLLAADGPTPRVSTTR
ncbi:DUF3426 domain-containing protein [Alloalcanivorax sp. C16-2]|uniref:DUF3426 domain-containing protein n=1 Tax=Alloalcanivorax TaxID=3020832 RepID=UPI0019317E30|nr:DUF3426 domain-containing protein [Alloalcanivorax marinus]MBL7250347.1 DUF3426 domain-containing protein [Alloalcanivorax marinus]